MAACWGSGSVWFTILLSTEEILLSRLLLLPKVAHRRGCSHPTQVKGSPNASLCLRQASELLQAWGDHGIFSGCMVLGFNPRVLEMCRWCSATPESPLEIEVNPAFHSWGILTAPQAVQPVPPRIIVPLALVHLLSQTGPKSIGQQKPTLG